MDIWRIEKIVLLSFLLDGVCSRDFSISLPKKIQALRGSCVIIKCRFEIDEQYNKFLTDRATGLWHKDGTKPKKIVFISSLSQNFFIKGNMTGKLQQKDCTTVFYDVKSNYSGIYYFRIESEGGLKFTYTDKSALIEVIDFPERPLVRVSVDGKALPDDQEVLEGSCVSVRCSAESLCSSPPPTLTWSSTPRIPLSERTQELISDLNFTADHTLTVTCTVTYQLQERNTTAHSSFTLRVQYAPKISSSSDCKIGNVTVCFCEADGNPSPKVQWYLSGRPVSNSSHVLISEERLNSTGLRSFISLHQSLTHTSTLQCVANNTHGSQTKLFQMTVFSQDKDKHIFSVLIGVPFGVFLLMIIMCIIVCCARVKITKEDDTGIIVADTAVKQDDENEHVYANNIMLSSPDITALDCTESLHYASVDFRNMKSESEEGRVSSLCDYAVIHYSGGVQETKICGRGDKNITTVIKS